jgi:hypothetical protein
MHTVFGVSHVTLRPKNKSLFTPHLPGLIAQQAALHGRGMTAMAIKAFVLLYTLLVGTRHSVYFAQVETGNTHKRRHAYYTEIYLSSSCIWGQKQRS